MASIKTIITVLVVSGLLVAALALWHQTQNAAAVPELLLDNEQPIDGPLTAEEQTVVNPIIDNTMNARAIMTTNRGVIELELFTEAMPVTTANFIKLAESDFYTNTKFHRVIKGFMIQGGDPNSRGDNEAIYGTGGPDENVPDEFVEGELLTNTRGTIAMANTGQPNSGGSQWFINLVDNTGLDFNKPPSTSKHPVFGRVVAGMDVVDTIGDTDTKDRDIPAEPVIIESIEIVHSQ